MEPIEYLVTKRTQRWSVLCGPAQHGPYVSCKSAVDSALAMARADFSKARAAIVVLDNDGHLEQLYDSTAYLPATH